MLNLVEIKKPLHFSFKSFTLYATNNSVEDTAYSLIQKNAKRLLSLKNIRGMLMDQTSENDYTIASYIMRRFGDLSPEQQQSICCMVKVSICKHLGKSDYAQKQLAKLEKEGITNINKVLKLADYLVPLALKYQIFGKMVEFLQEKPFPDDSLEIYMSDIIGKRNLLAHKKLEISGDQQNIIGFNNNR